MRIMFSTPPMEGLLGPLLPLMEAASRGGHQVVAATGGDLEKRVAATGASMRAVGRSPMESAMQAFGIAPTLLEVPEEWRFGAALFGHVIAPVQAEALRALTADWRPDLIVHPPVDIAAPLIAAELGVPSVTCGTGGVPPADLLEALEAAVAPLWQEAAMAQPAFCGLFQHRYLDIFPPSLQHDRGPATPVTMPMRPEMPSQASGDLPSWADTLGARPIVYVSLGTVPLFNQPPEFEPILRGLSQHDVDVVATVGELNDPAGFDVPGNVVVEQWLPLRTLLNRCAAVVCHGGSGTILSAFAAGLPMVVVPKGADQFVNGRICSQTAAARVLWPDQVTATNVAAEADWLLSADAATAAAEISGEIAAMPSPDRVLSDLQALTGPGAAVAQ